MSCLVKREDKKINLNLKDKTYETIDEFQERIKNEEEVIDVSSIKKNFKIDHIDKKEFQKVVKEISLSQITRFYSVLENRNFSTGTDYIEDFLREQVKRAETTNDKDLIKAKPFYEYYGKYFLRIDFTKDKAEKKIVEYSKEANLKNEIELTLIKAYVRYCIGKKKLESEGK
ncbi:hypothetical protein [Fusobacterium pseudoperiodonticum]|uniref:Uncharacterized protein n=1 Tax=Fusobacterium pseudoperiodonticum TaxID=2663009 RepID=A0A2D3PT21_9FUSO|nr:hypothetical protein [Fusobacterium pseudoperiodonticum]ATV70843.1 hypothetical protein CTM98_09415 [Fusobacterium pseudoperiodonticum]